MDPLLALILMESIACIEKCVEKCVIAYFTLVHDLFLAALVALSSMVNTYLGVLETVTQKITIWPCNIILVMGIAVSGDIIIRILHEVRFIEGRKSPKNRKHLHLGWKLSERVVRY